MHRRLAAWKVIIKNVISLLGYVNNMQIHNCPGCLKLISLRLNALFWWMEEVQGYNILLIQPTMVNQ